MEMPEVRSRSDESPAQTGIKPAFSIRSRPTAGWNSRMARKNQPRGKRYVRKPSRLSIARCRFASNLEMGIMVVIARPPVGDLRWRPPQPPKPWEGVRRADQFSAGCSQAKTGPIGPIAKNAMAGGSSEACLYLNVGTVASKAEKSSTNPLPRIRRQTVKVNYFRTGRPYGFLSRQPPSGRARFA